MSDQDDPRAIERAIELAGLAPASVALRRRVLDAAPRPARAVWWRPAAAFATAAALGFVVGWVVEPPLPVAGDAWVEAGAESLLLGPLDDQSDEGDLG